VLAHARDQDGVAALNTQEIKAALRERYGKPEWAIFFEVANGTGARQQRYADAVAMNLFPSRGLEIHCFEIKKSRNDWKKELKNPAKAETVFRYCDRWWIVAAENVVRDGELPPTWGLILAKDGRLRQAKAAPPLSPVSLDRAFAAALLRRSGERDESEIDAIVEKRVEATRQELQNRANQDVERRTRQFNEMHKRVAEIKDKTGIDLVSWPPVDEVCKAIKFALVGGLFASYSGIDELRRCAERLIQKIDEAKSVADIDSGHIAACTDSEGCRAEAGTAPRPRKTLKSTKLRAERHA
jgi:hypothetical protein